MNNLAFSKPVLIIANSAQMLSRLALAVGVKVVVIDCYADMDCQKIALALYKVADLSLEQIKQAVQQLVQNYAIDYVVYGSGLEAHPESLAYLATRYVLLGNAVPVFQQVLHKPSFFANLKKCHIRHPVTVFTSPQDGQDWLFKPFVGQGGLGIQHYQLGDSVDNQGYWQQTIQGQAMSVTFLAAAGQFKILGFNQQWQAGSGFLFAGVCNQAELSEPIKQMICSWLQQLVRIYGLRGLASLDFIYASGQCYVLEINARPPASMVLYDQQVFNWHVQACLVGQLPAEILPASPPKAYQIVYAQKTTQIPHAINWPDWAYDLPETGVIINRGEPICSIISAQNTVAQTRAQLAQRQLIIEEILST